jgi:hypothetical protein
MRTKVERLARPVKPPEGVAHTQFLHVYWIPGNHLNNSVDWELSDQIPLHIFRKCQCHISQRAAI